MGQGALPPPPTPSPITHTTPQPCLLWPMQCKVSSHHPQPVCSWNVPTRNAKLVGSALHGDSTLCWMMNEAECSPMMVNGASMMAEWCLNDGRMMPQWWLNGASMMAEWCLNDGWMVSQWWPNDASMMAEWMAEWCLNDDRMMPQWWLNGASMMAEWCLNDGWVVPQWWLNGASMMLNGASMMTEWCLNDGEWWMMAECSPNDGWMKLELSWILRTSIYQAQGQFGEGILLLVKLVAKATQDPYKIHVDLPAPHIAQLYRTPPPPTTTWLCVKNSM